jgi:uncharacterized protein (TIGR02265 family)
MKIAARYPAPRRRCTMSPHQPPPESAFNDPDCTRPLDLEALVSLIPATATVKGVFVDGIEKLMTRVPDGRKRLYDQMPRTRYLPFKDYARGEVMRVEARAAELLFPRIPLREALRRTARLIYPMFLDSLPGKVVFGVLGNDVESVLRLGPRGNSVVVNFGAVSSESVGTRRWRVHYRDYYSFLDCGDVGVFEGIIQHYGFAPRVRVAQPSTFEAWYDIQWS